MRPAGACASSEALLLALGVMTRPGLLREVKFAVRTTWAVDEPEGVRVCFVVSRHPNAWSASVPTMATKHDGVDELIVNATPHPVGSQMFQVSFGWWLIASRQFPRAMFLAKAEHV